MLVTLVTLPNDASLELLLCDDISSEGANAPVNSQSITQSLMPRGPTHIF